MQSKHSEKTKKRAFGSKPWHLVVKDDMGNRKVLSCHADRFTACVALSEYVQRHGAANLVEIVHSNTLPRDL